MAFSGVTIMDIIIGFSRAKSPWKIGSKIIAESEKRDYSHAYIRFNSKTTGISIVYQASLGMVNAYNYDLFKEHNVVVEEYIVSTDKHTEILTFLQTNLGKPYSKIQILTLSLKKLLGFEVKYKNNDSEFICSELALKIIQIVRPDAKYENQDYCTPSDLNKLVNELNIPRYL